MAIDNLCKQVIYNIVYIDYIDLQFYGNAEGVFSIDGSGRSFYIPELYEAS